TSPLLCDPLPCARLLSRSIRTPRLHSNLVAVPQLRALDEEQRGLAPSGPGPDRKSDSASSLRRARSRRREQRGLAPEGPGPGVAAAVEAAATPSLRRAARLPPAPPRGAGPRAVRGSRPRAGRARAGASSGAAATCRGRAG